MTPYYWSGQGYRNPKIMTMTYKYLVANPTGTFLVRCKTMEEVRTFIKKHCKRCNKTAIKSLFERKLKPSDYQVRNLEEIPTHNQI